MIDARAIEAAIVDGLKRYAACEVVRANEMGQIPPYPYIAYTITTPLQSRSGTYSVDSNGIRYMSFEQTWSFTVQADTMEGSWDTAFKAYDWFNVAGKAYHDDLNIVVLRVGNITGRDNLITIQYEHRNGFDVTFRLLHTVEMAEEESGGYIETINIKMEG